VALAAARASSGFWLVMLSRLDSYGLNRRLLAVPTGLPWPFDFSNLIGGLAINVSHPFPYRPANPAREVLCAARQRSRLPEPILPYAASP